MDAKNLTDLVKRAETYVCKARSNSIPKDAYLQVTEKCNGRCQMCKIWQNKNPISPQAKLLFAIIHALRDKKFEWVTLWGGEPYLHQDIIKVMEEVKNCGLMLQLITNGTLVTGEKLHATHELADNIVFSIDSPRPEIHDLIRGKQGFFRQAVSNIYALVDLNQKNGKGPNIELDTTITKHNIRSLASMVLFSRQFGDVLVDFDPAQIQGTGNNTDASIIAIPPEDVDATLDELVSIAENGAHITSPAKLELIRKYLKGKYIDGACYSLFKDLLIAPNGQTNFCWGWDKSTGNILDSDFEQKWQCAIAENTEMICGKAIRCKKCGFSHVRWPDPGYKEIVEGVNFIRKAMFEKLVAPH